MNTVNNHTPGPWHVDARFAMRVVNDVDATVATTGCSDSLSESWEANARLIAAAPDMLAALEMLFASTLPPPRSINKILLAAIAKARNK